MTAALLTHFFRESSLRGLYGGDEGMEIFLNDL